MIKCPVCGGLGKTETTVDDDIVFEVCEYCGGIGKVKESEDE